MAGRVRREALTVIMNEVLRFEFKAPTEQEIRILSFTQRWKWLFWLVALVLYAALCLLDYLIFQSWYIALSFLGAVLLSGWGGAFLNRAEHIKQQSDYGLVELTPSQLRVSRSQTSLLIINWNDFIGYEVEKGWLQLRFYNVQITLDRASTARLDRIPLAEIQNSKELIAELEKRVALQQSQTEAIASS